MPPDERGVALRFVREFYWKASDFTMTDLVRLSCRQLGHTFEHNEGESICQVCGSKKPETTNGESE